MKSCTLTFIVLLLVSNFYVPILSKRTVMVTRFDGKCKRVENPKIISVYSGLKRENQKLIMNGTMTVTADIHNFSLTVNIQRCRSKENPDSCVNVYSFVNKNGCQLLESKLGLFNAFYKSIQPPWKCPIRKGIYIQQNGTWDISPIYLLPIENSYWKAQGNHYDGNTGELIGCIEMDAKVSNDD